MSGSGAFWLSFVLWAVFLGVGAGCSQLAALFSTSLTRQLLCKSTAGWGASCSCAHLRARLPSVVVSLIYLCALWLSGLPLGGLMRSYSMHLGRALSTQRAQLGDFPCCACCGRVSVPVCEGARRRCWGSACLSAAVAWCLWACWGWGSPLLQCVVVAAVCACPSL